MKKFHKIIGLVLPLVMIAFIAGCGGSSSSTSTTANAATPVSNTTTTDTSSQSDSVSSPSAGQGTLSISLTDAPAAEFLAVYVTIAEVHVHSAGSDEVEGTEDKETEDDGEWIVIPMPNTTYDLLELQNGITTFLGEKNIPSGDYTQLRLILANAPVGTAPDGEPHPHAHYIVLAEDQLPYALTVPSNTLKQVHNFTLVDGSEMSMLIDFDAKKSIHPAGKKWMLQPVITVKTELE